jgi:hypothetical protein
MGAEMSGVFKFGGLVFTAPCRFEGRASGFGPRPTCRGSCTTSPEIAAEVFRMVLGSVRLDDDDASYLVRAVALTPGSDTLYLELRL